jgi:septal ring factor EnvC (AmiA/AmiB activator)
MSARVKDLMTNEHISWQGTAARLADMVTELEAALAVAERERDEYKEAAAAEAQLADDFKRERDTLRAAVHNVIAEIEAGNLDSLGRVLRELKRVSPDATVSPEGEAS